MVRAGAVIAVCIKWVDLRPEIEPLTGRVVHDYRRYGLAPADEAALEQALRFGEEWGMQVVAVTAGPPGAEVMLRQALAVGAARAVRVEVAEDTASEGVAAALASVVMGAEIVICGAWSADRGSGVVPAHLAALLGVSQALGLLEVEPAEDHRVPGELRLWGERRLDGGRREVLDISAPAVISIEGPNPKLRRASLSGVIAARTAPVERQVLASPPDAGLPVAHVGPLRPRARELAAPSPDLDARSRILALMGGLVDHAPPKVLRLDADEAAAVLIEHLEQWGYV